MTPASRRTIKAGVKETGRKFAAGIVDTNDKRKLIYAFMSL
jgi:hypothetical protein